MKNLTVVKNEQHPNLWVTKGFWLAGAYNVFGMLIFSKLFTNTVLGSVDPDVFSWLGQIAILLWGFAYWSVAKSYHYVPQLIAVFAIEKLVYSITWLHWLFQKGHSLASIASESLLTALFYSVYGAGDILFCIFFSWVALNLKKKHSKSEF